MSKSIGTGAVFAALLATAVFAIGTMSAVATTEGATPFGKNDPWMPEWMMREPDGPGPMSPTMMARMLRHAEFLNFGVPKEYKDARSPLQSDAGVLAEGRTLYLDNCAACHDPEGMGDGDIGQALSPSPAVLAFLITRPVAVDPYLLWAISDGGAKFDSAMPAFKNNLTRDEIWKIIAFMRAGFPLQDPKK